MKVIDFSTLLPQEGLVRDIPFCVYLALMNGETVDSIPEYAFDNLKSWPAPCSKEDFEWAEKEIKKHNIKY